MFKLLVQPWYDLVAEGFRGVMPQNLSADEIRLHKIPQETVISLYRLPVPYYPFRHEIRCF